MGIEPSRLKHVDSVWEETKSPGEAPEDNFEFYNKLDAILDEQDLEDEGLDWSASESDSNESDLQSDSTPTARDLDSVTETISDLMVHDNPVCRVPEPNGSGTFHENGKDPPDGGQAEAQLTAVGYIRPTGPKRDPVPPDKFVQEDGSSFDPEPGINPGRPETEGFGKGRPKGLKDQGRNPDKTERRKSFEKAASKLAAIPRTKSGVETTRERAVPDVEPG